MRLWIALALAALMIGVALGAQDPAHPFPNHEEPPAGWTCHPATSDEEVRIDAHACVCLGMRSDPVCQKPNPDMPGFSMPETQDNAKCKVFCHRDSCTCKTNCNT